MTTDVVTVPAGASLRQAVGRMLRDGVGSVVLTREGTPSGIVTESDALKAGYRFERPLAEIPVTKAASDSLTTITERATIRKAVRQMRRHDVKKLPVVNGMELVGILTMTDVVVRHESLIDEAIALEEGRDGWSPEHDTEDR